MTWSVTIPPTQEEAFEKAVKDAKLPDYAHGEAAAEQQFSAAKAALIAYFQARMYPFGEETTWYFSASMGGHANTGTSGAPGATMESINVNLLRVVPPLTSKPDLPQLAGSGASTQ